MERKSAAREAAWAGVRGAVPDGGASDVAAGAPGVLALAATCRADLCELVGEDAARAFAAGLPVLPTAVLLVPSLAEVLGLEMEDDGEASA